MIEGSVSFVSDAADRSFHKHLITDLLGCQVLSHFAAVRELLSLWVALDDEVNRALLVKRGDGRVGLDMGLFLSFRRWFKELDVRTEEEAAVPVLIGESELESKGVWAKRFLLDNLKLILVHIVPCGQLSERWSTLWDIEIRIITVDTVRMLSGKFMHHLFSVIDLCFLADSLLVDKEACYGTYYQTAGSECNLLLLIVDHSQTQTRMF